MKQLILTILLCLSMYVTSFAQGFEVPACDFKTEADYPKYEQSVLDAYHWLLKTPVAQQAGKSEAVETFIMQWAMGTPSVTVSINEVLGNIMVENKKLSVFCIGGFTAYVLKGKKYDGVLNTAESRGASQGEIVEATYAAIRDIADYCERNKEVVARVKPFGAT